MDTDKGEEAPVSFSLGYHFQTSKSIWSVPHKVGSWEKAQVLRILTSRRRSRHFHLRGSLAPRQPKTNKHTDRAYGVRANETSQLNELFDEQFQHTGSDSINDFKFSVKTDKITS
jgi:hypothetical protein